MYSKEKYLKSKKQAKIKRHCLVCKKQFFALYNSDPKQYCSNSCVGTANGKRQLDSGHWNWKGGISRKVIWQNYYRKHKKELIEKATKYYWEHLDECRQRGVKSSKLWKKNNPEKARLNSIVDQHRRRARKMELNETFGKEQMEIVRNTFDNNCFKCNSKENLTFDHHNPLSAGFALNLDNAVLLCNSCNCKKSKMEPKRFYNSRELEVLNQLLEIQKLN